MHYIERSFDGAHGVCAVDLDNDLDMDVLGAALYANEIAWWENDGVENFTKHVIDGSFDYAWDIYTTDMDNDSDLDVLGAARLADEIAWWENDGRQEFTKHLIEESFDGAIDVYAIDLDNDEDLDVLGTAYFNNDISWWENDGNENFTKHVIDGFFDGAHSVYAIDLDKDFDADVLGTAFLGNDIAWWENDLTFPQSLQLEILFHPIWVDPGDSLWWKIALTNNHDTPVEIDEVRLDVEGPASVSKAMWSGNGSMPPDHRIEEWFELYVPLVAPPGIYTCTTVASFEGEDLAEAGFECEVVNLLSSHSSSTSPQLNPMRNSYAPMSIRHPPPYGTE